jgi:hypothetical protein
LHFDQSTAAAVANRFDLFPSRGVSPISRVGHGFRRAIKPDILMPVNEECVGRVVFFSRSSLERALPEYVTHYHQERNQQGLRNRCRRVPALHKPA